MKLQLIYKDEYGQTSIMRSGTDVAALVKEAKTLVTTDNMDNALTLEEKKREWENYYVEVVSDDGNDTTEGLYGGTSVSGNTKKHVVYVFENGVPKKNLVASFRARIFIGSDNKKELYAEKQVLGRPGQTKPMEDINNQEIENKGVYYFKVI